MTPSRTEDRAVGKARGPNMPALESDEILDVPMLREVTRLPGMARATFSPHAYYALSRVGQQHIDPTVEGLWLVEEPCPTVSEIGFSLHGIQFTHAKIQAFVRGLPGAKPRDLVVRYNRALFARGVLNEVLLCERDERGNIHERLRCHPREEVQESLDLSATLRERERFAEIHLAKVARADDQRITLADGTAALERMRDEQAARAQRQRKTKREPIVAKPIRAHSRSEAAALKDEKSMAALAEHLRGGEPVDRYDAQDEVLDGAAGTPSGAPASTLSQSGGHENAPASGSVSDGSESAVGSPRPEGSDATDVIGGPVLTLAPKESTDAQEKEVPPHGTGSRARKSGVDKHGSGEAHKGRRRATARSTRSSRVAESAVQMAPGGPSRPPAGVTALVEALGGQLGFFSQDS